MAMFSECPIPKKGKSLQVMADQTLIVVFTGVVALSTAVYAILTFQLVSETRRMREAQTEPRVSVRVEMHQAGDFSYELVIRNEGQGVARNVRFDFHGDPTYFHREFQHMFPTVDKWPVIKDGMEYLEPGETLRFPIGTVSVEGFRSATQAPWTLAVKCESLHGKQYEASFTLDFSRFRGMVFEPNRLREIAGHLEAISRDISNLRQG